MNKTPEQLRSQYNNRDRNLIQGHELWALSDTLNGINNYVTHKGRIALLKSMNMLPMKGGAVQLPNFRGTKFFTNKMFKLTGETYVDGRLCKEYLLTEDDGTYRIHDPIRPKKVLTEEQKINPMLTLNQS